MTRRPLVGPAADAVVLGWLAAAAVAVVARGRLPGGGWLALHMLLLGAVTNAIVAYSERFALALLHAPSLPARLLLVRLVVLNTAVAVVLAGVQTARPGLVAAGGLLLGVVVAAHAVRLARLAVGAGRPAGTALGGRLGVVVWFYVAAAAALLAGAGAGVLLGGGAAGDYRAVRLAHAHLNLLGWVGLTVLGTQLTLLPTALRTRMSPRVPTAATLALPVLLEGVVGAGVGFGLGWRWLAALGLVVYATGALLVLAPLRQSLGVLLAGRRGTGGAWLLVAALGWLVVAVLADLVAVLAVPALADVDRLFGRFAPMLALGLAGQVLAGALTVLLPAAWGGGPGGNRRLARVLQLGWRPRLVAVNAGVALAAVVPGWPGRAGWWLAGAGLGAFLPLAVAALAWHLVERVDPGRPYHATAAREPPAQG